MAVVWNFGFSVWLFLKLVIAEEKGGGGGGEGGSTKAIFLLSFIGGWFQPTNKPGTRVRLFQFRKIVRWLHCFGDFAVSCFVSFSK